MFDPTNGIVGNRDLIRVAVAAIRPSGAAPRQLDRPAGGFPRHDGLGPGQRDRRGRRIRRPTARGAAGRGLAGAAQLRPRPAASSRKPRRRRGLTLALSFRRARRRHQGAKTRMRIRTGYAITFDSPAPTPMLLMLSVHPPGSATASPRRRCASTRRSRRGTIPIATAIPAPASSPRRPAHRLGRFPGRGWRPARRGRAGRDPAPGPGPARRRDGLPPRQPLLRHRQAVEHAWQLFGHTPEGWARVQAIVDYVHNHIRFDYQRADATRSALDGFNQREGVCRDFAHLAVTFCRCMNIPARYCTAISAISACRRCPTRWISRPGSRSISVGAGTRSTPATTPADRPHRHGPRPRRHRRGDLDPVRPSLLAGFRVHTDEVV